MTTTAPEPEGSEPAPQQYQEEVQGQQEQTAGTTGEQPQQDGDKSA